MAWDETDVVTDRKELLANRVNQLLVISHGEVRATDRPRKDHVTHPRELGFPVQKHDVARGVAWTENLRSAAQIGVNSKLPILNGSIRF